MFVVLDRGWNARARAFVLAARGLAARGHEVMLACESECAVQVHANEAGVALVALQSGASVAANAMQLRRSLKERPADVIFTHTDAELLVASSAVRLGGRGAAVIRRVPPFSVVSQGRSVKLATRMAPTGLLFSTEQDRQTADAKRYRLPSAVAPLAIDVTVHDAVREVSKVSVGAPTDGRLIVCVHDGSDNRRVLTAMRTLALLAPFHNELHLAIVGTGSLDDLRMQGAALGINAMVTYLGSRDDELSIMRAADAGWIAASGDAAAFAALDFMAFRKPVLAERSPLTEHFVSDGVAGVLLPPADPRITAASVAVFLAKHEQCVQMGNAGRARLQRDFPYEAMIQGFEQAVGGAGSLPRTA